MGPHDGRRARPVRPGRHPRRSRGAQRERDRGRARRDPGRVRAGAAARRPRAQRDRRSAPALRGDLRPRAGLPDRPPGGVPVHLVAARLEHSRLPLARGRAPADPREAEGVVALAPGRRPAEPGDRDRSAPAAVGEAGVLVLRRERDRPRQLHRAFRAATRPTGCPARRAAAFRGRPPRARSQITANAGRPGRLRPAHLARALRQLLGHHPHGRVLRLHLPLDRRSRRRRRPARAARGSTTSTRCRSSCSATAATAPATTPGATSPRPLRSTARSRSGACSTRAFRLSSRKTRLGESRMWGKPGH